LKKNIIITNSKNGIIVYALSIIMILNMCACAGVTKNKKTFTAPEGKDTFIHVIINDQAIKSEKYGSKLVNKIEETFRNAFENVSVQSGYDDPKNNEMLITPRELTVKRDEDYHLRCSSISRITVLYNDVCQQYRINRSEDVNFKAPLLVDIATGVVFAACIVATGGLAGYTAQKGYRYAAANKALTSTAIELYTKVTKPSQFKVYAESQKMLGTSPASLVAKIEYADKSSLIPNSTIDAGEMSAIVGTITNNGKGTAFDINVIIESSYKNIDFPEKISISNLQPGESKAITIPLTADLSLASGTASFRIKTLEKRGYSARPIELQIPAAGLRGPELLFTSCNINDSSGLANGDGDGVTENNETIELNPYVSNKGKGDALKISVKLSKITDGIEIIKSNDDISRIGPGGVGKSTLAFTIPRTFAQPEINYTISATDIRGITTEKNFSIPFTPSKPTLKSTFQVVTNNGEDVPGLENGKSFLLKITAANSGNNLAKNINLNLTSASPQVKISPYNSHIGNLKPNGSTGPVSIPFSIARSCGESTIVFTAELKQDYFPSLTDTFTLPVIVRQPDLEYETTLLNGVGKHGVMQNSSPTFRVSVRNKGTLPAENVIFQFKAVHPDIEYEKTEKVGVIKPGEGKYKDFSFFLRGDSDLKDLSISVNIKQADFETKKERLAFQVKPQAFLVQTIAGTSSASTPTTGQPFSMPPQIYINSPNKNEITYSEIINFRGNALAVGQGNAIEKISITLNNKAIQIIPYSDSIRPKPGRLMQESVDNKLIFKGKIALDSNTNKIKIKCIDRNNNEAQEEISVVRKARLGNIYAVVIGINHFANDSLNLHYASSDAQKFYQYLMTETGGKIPQDRVKLLINEKANSAAIIKALTNFLGKAGSEDTVELYLATHGVIGNDGMLYYLAHNSEMDNLMGTAVSSAVLETIIKNKIRAGKVIIFLDACHSGQSGLSDIYRRSVSPYEVNQKNNNLAAQLSKYAKGVAIFSASSAQGYSEEDTQWDGGVFTYHLLEGLNGEANKNGDQWVTINEIDTYLRSEVMADTQGNQMPKMNTTLSGDTPVSQLLKQ